MHEQDFIETIANRGLSHLRETCGNPRRNRHGKFPIALPLAAECAAVVLFDRLLTPARCSGPGDWKWPAAFESERSWAPVLSDGKMSFLAHVHAMQHVHSTSA